PIDRPLEPLWPVVGMADQRLREDRVSVVEGVEEVIGLGISCAELPVVRGAKIGLLVRTRADAARDHDEGQPRGVAQMRTRCVHCPLPPSWTGRSNDRPSVIALDRTRPANVLLTPTSAT